MVFNLAVRESEVWLSPRVWCDNVAGPGVSLRVLGLGPRLGILWIWSAVLSHRPPVDRGPRPGIEAAVLDWERADQSWMMDDDQWGWGACPGVWRGVTGSRRSLFIKNDRRWKWQLDDKLYKVTKIEFAQKTLSSSFNLNVKNSNVKPKSNSRSSESTKQFLNTNQTYKLKINTFKTLSVYIQTIPVGCVKTVSNRKYRCHTIWSLLRLITMLGGDCRLKLLLVVTVLCLYCMISTLISVTRLCITSHWTNRLVSVY